MRSLIATLIGLSILSVSVPVIDKAMNNITHARVSY